MIGACMILEHDKDVLITLIDSDDLNIHFSKRNYIGRDYRIESIMKILKFTYLKLNILKLSERQILLQKRDLLILLNLGILYL